MRRNDGKRTGIENALPSRMSLRLMAGLVPAIHVFPQVRIEEVDARDKCGHDE
jgi:hypothetical protein